MIPRWSVVGLTVLSLLETSGLGAAPASDGSPMAPVKIKGYVSFQKPAFIFQPKGRLSEALLREGKALVFAPNVGPSVGVGATYKQWLGASLSRSVEPWQRRARDRGRTDATHYELHLTPGAFGVDVYYLDYHGFFVDEVNQGDLRPFQDTFLTAGGGIAKRPRMELRLKGANLLYNFFPERLSLSAVMNQSGRQKKSGGALLAMARWNRYDMTNPAPLLSGIRESGDAPLASLKGGSLTSYGFLPGAAYTFVRGSFFANATVFWGYVFHDYRLSGVDEDADKQLVDTGDLRGSVGFNQKRWFYGFKGYKTLQSTTTRGSVLTQTNARLETFFGRRF